ncbi:BppU family phage baseplate upper protein [Staphylococcus pasteuri]|uniref:BppU family phage baseplate upper protein n=1 Tax=Staphylococcus pasteuri TaxID=45972 RepID=UPI001AD851DA|nr:BppU family phage baseplate upper protein [Staphylococcus pasteuri]MBM6506836.1 BppU family phage baseplate upper protein [Staphylococcus pasteuri]QQT21399.1 BppU family phage baseplate upper protein [Staphylococcus pasteuri]
MSELEKIGKIDLSEEAYLKPVSNKGIGFYNLDKNTAKFQFRVSKDDKPLLISDKNVKGYAFFKAQNGTDKQRPSTSGVLDIEFIDPMRGLIGITVPQWFLKNVANTTVLGEIYLSLNDFNTTGKDDTVVLGTFSFSVRDSLVNQIESDIKVSYIRMFDELRSELELKVQQLKQDIGDTQSLIESIKQIANDSLVKINKAQADAISAITDALLSSINSIDLERDEALRQIDAKRDAVKTDYDLAADSFNKLSDDKTQTFNNNVSSANQTIDDKVNTFNQTLADGGFTTSSDVDNKLATVNWQKYKLTNEDGSRILLDGAGADITTLNTGQYQTYNYVGMPANEGDMNAYWNVDVTTGADNVKQIIATLSYKNKQFIKVIHKGQDLGWKLLTNDTIDTGWIDLQLINGASPNNSLISNGGFTSAYRSITSNGITRKMIRLNATTLTHGQTLALLPKGFVNNLMFFGISTPRNKNSGRISLNTSGTVNFDATVDPSAWTNTDYIYGQYEWTE